MIVTLERVEFEGGAIGLITRLEPAPPSRHLTARLSSPEAVRPLRKGRPAQRRYKEGHRQSTLAVEGHRQSTLADAAGAAAGIVTWASEVAGREQQAQGPGVFAFPAMAVVPGVALPAGGGALAVAGGAAAAEASVPPIEPDAAHECTFL